MNGRLVKGNSLTNLIDSNSMVLQLNYRQEGFFSALIGSTQSNAMELVDHNLSMANEFGSDYEVALTLILRGHILAETGGDRKPDHARARELLADLGVVSLPSITR